MQKQTFAPITDGSAAAWQYATDAGHRAMELVQSSASHASTATERTVRRHPLASVGIAFGGGIAFAALGFLLLSPKKPAHLPEHTRSHHK